VNVGIEGRTGEAAATLDGAAFDPSVNSWQVNFGAGVTWRLNTTTSLRLDYTGSVGDKTTTPWGFNLGFTKKF